MVAISNDYYYIQSSNQHYYRFGEILESSELLDLFRGRSPAHVDLHAETSVDSDDTPVLQLPYQSRFARSQSRPALHAGIVMTAMDSAMGLATMLAMEELSSLATLELRYDELRLSLNIVQFLALLQSPVPTVLSFSYVVPFGRA